MELSAQVRVRPFYEALGYTAGDDEYLDEGCPYIHLEKAFSLWKVLVNGGHANHADIGA